MTSTEIEHEEVDYRESDTQSTEEEATLTTATPLGAVTATYRRKVTTSSSVTPA